MSRYIGHDGYYKYHPLLGLSALKHGKTLESYILESIGRDELGFKDIYQKVLDTYGTVSSRIVHRRLFKLKKLELIVRINDIPITNPDLKYRLSKTAIRKL